MIPEDLTLEFTENLINIVPTAEELSAVTSYSGPGKLGKAESFYLLLSTIPRLSERLSIHEICFRWPQDADRIWAQVKTFTNACKEFENLAVNIVNPFFH